MLNIKQKSRLDNNTRLELNSCSACGKHYQRLVTKVCLFYIQHESSSCIFFLHFSDARLCCLYGCSCVCRSHPAEENHAPHGRSINLYQPCGKGESHAYCYDNNRSGSHQSRRHAAYYVAHLLASQFYVVFFVHAPFPFFLFSICCRLLCRRRVSVVMSAPCRLPAAVVLRRLRLSCRVQAGSLPVGSTFRASR